MYDKLVILFPFLNSPKIRGKENELVKLVLKKVFLNDPFDNHRFLNNKIIIFTKGLYSFILLDCLQLFYLMYEV